ncbi:hypothetical protein GTP45_20770 [Pseudoduganella sp. FT55W]|uniref:Uncharacterized protein n=1 Tax=Duganella rivi TaxID=2666083 RepID=A0A7X4GT91_9BURK|nr:hypothetical protein [Duganella rivi]MYM69252.1 hypothetical protein [Duganella rivi]
MKRPIRKPQKKKGPGRDQAIPDLFGNTVPIPDSTSTVARFFGTANPRYLRALHALLIRPMSRKHLDDTIGCANTPDAILNIRELGLGKSGLPCTMIDDTDRDGRRIKRGIYSLTEAGRRAVMGWLRMRERKDGE